MEDWIFVLFIGLLWVSVMFGFNDRDLQKQIDRQEEEILKLKQVIKGYRDKETL